MKNIQQAEAENMTRIAFDALDCLCENRNDEVPNETTFYTDAVAALKGAAPEGSTVCAIGFDRADIFLRAGYRVVENSADIVIARGGAREFDTARKLDCRKLILAPTHAFSATSTERFVARDGAFSIMRIGKKPHAAAFDVNDIDRNLASVFGELVALDLAAFDYSFGLCMRGERADSAVCAEVTTLVTELTSDLARREKDVVASKAALVKAGMTAARIVERTPELLNASGAAQVAEAVRMLYTAEERPLGMRGETEMLVTPYVVDFYIKSLTHTAFELPPDNNRRIDSVCEYFGADIRRACVYTTAIFPPRKMRLYEYRRDEFRKELVARLTELKSREIAAWNVFKRLYPDDGYGLKNLIDKTDVGICLALAPDVFTAESMLSFLKQTGRLEKYIP